jgi:hypothetical protein
VPPAPIAQETPTQRLLTERALAARGLDVLPQTIEELEAAPLIERPVTVQEIQRQMAEAPVVRALPPPPPPPPPLPPIVLPEPAQMPIQMPIQMPVAAPIISEPEIQRQMATPFTRGARGLLL